MQPILNSLDVVLQDGFMYSILAMGYYISYSILDFPDLTVEGTVLSGGVVFGLLVKAGVNPYIALLAAFAVGFVFGGITGILHVKLKIRPLLCGILVSTALISVNLVSTIIGNGGDFKGDGLSTIDLGRSVPTLTRIFPATALPSDFYGFNLKKLLVFFAMALIFKIITDVFLKTKCGLLLRAAGDNPNYVTMLAKNQGTSKILGLAIGNAYAAVSGALIVQSRGNVNQGIGIGMVVIGLASLIIGLSVFGKIKFMKPTTMVIGGSIIYQASLGIAALLGVPTVYNKIIMAALFTAALIVSGKLKKKRGAERD
ncbi:MAG: ABC transporter permease [Clostridiales bacterium]|nr:ABC transporter permease [Clostridiales bacterium]